MAPTATVVAITCPLTGAEGSGHTAGVSVGVSVKIGTINNNLMFTFALDVNF